MAKTRKPENMIVDAQKPKKRIAVSFQGWILFLLIPVSICYFIFAYIYTDNYVHIIDVSGLSAQMPMTRITAARGELITFGIHVSTEDQTPWASPSGFHLVLNGLEKPLQLIKPSQPFWPASGSYVSIIDTHFDNPRILWASIVLPESIVGSESRQLVGEIQGDYITPFVSSAFTYNIPIQIQMVPQGIYLWTNGRLLFYILTGISGLLYTLSGLLYWRKSKQKVQGKGSLKRYLFNVFKIIFIFTAFYGLGLFWADNHIFYSKFTDTQNSMGFILLIILILLILNWRRLSHVDLENRSRYRTRTAG